MKNNMVKGMDLIIEGLKVIRDGFAGEVVAEDKVAKVLDGALTNLANDMIEAREEKDKKSKKTDKTPREIAQESVNKVEKEAVTVGDRKAELEAMSYNEIKALCKVVGVKAIGGKDLLISQIIVAEQNSPVVEEEEEDNTPLAREVVLGKADTSKPEAKTNGKKSKKQEPKVEEPEVEEDVEEEEEEGSEILSALNELEIEELAEICSEHKLSTKGKKQALVDRIVDAISSGKIDADELFGEESEEDESEEEDVEEEGEVDNVDDFIDFLADLEIDELKAIAKEMGVKLTKKDNEESIIEKLVADVDALESALEKLGYYDEEEAEEDDSEEDSEEDEDSEEEEVEISEERAKKEGQIDKDIRAKYKNKKLKDSTIKEYLKKYYEGDPDCKDCKGCSKEDALDCYVTIQTSLVDDDGEVVKLEEPYVRDGVDYCCGKELEENEVGDLFCEICGTSYEQ